MKAMVLREYELPMLPEERSLSDPVGAEVLLRIRAAGVCGTDLKLFRGKNPRLKLPLVLGHEFAGEVVALGPEVHQRHIGDRVVVYMYMNCGQCEPCLTGHENLCSNRRGFFGFDRDGGFAEYVLVPEANLVPVPEAVSFEEAAILGDAVATSWHAVRTQADLKPTQTLMVMGLGGFRASRSPVWASHWRSGHCGRFGAIQAGNGHGEWCPIYGERSRRRFRPRRSAASPVVKGWTQ